MCIEMEESSSSLRRRSVSSHKEDTLPSPADLHEKQRPSPSPAPHGITWSTAFFPLLISRYLSAKSNLIHDCDEVFNYWEPLHYLLYKSGFQTWEYSSEFALRSYLYLLFHTLVAGPASWWFGEGLGKVHVFYTVRLALGILSAVSEAALVVAISQRYGKRLAAYTLMLLCFTSGCFSASTSFLPSTFSMYSMTFAVAALLSGKPRLAVAVAAVGVLLGWPFSVLAALPIVIYALTTGGFMGVFWVGLTTSACILVPLVLADRFFYGRWTVSVLNLVLYNVAGGGDSSLYGVESPSFYLRNGFNNFNFAIILALMFPLVVLIGRQKSYGSLLIFVSPLYLWLGFMSLQAHKEERFLYPVYTLICLAASAAVEILPELVKKNMRVSDNSVFVMAAKILRPLILGTILVLSHSRTTSLLSGYSAPLKVFTNLPAVPDGRDMVVCIGSEWHRFPSSFFLPSPKYQVQWLDDGFRGLLPLPFNSSAGGTAAAPSHFNKDNQASSEQYRVDVEACSYLVELDLKRATDHLRGSNTTLWEVVVKFPFLDIEKSPALHRAFFIPWAWQRSNTFGSYRLLKRTS